MQCKLLPCSLLLVVLDTSRQAAESTTTPKHQNSRITSVFGFASGLLFSSRPITSSDTSTREPTSPHPCGSIRTVEPVPLAAARRFILELAFPYTRTTLAWRLSGAVSLTWLCRPLQNLLQIRRASRASLRAGVLGKVLFVLRREDSTSHETGNL